MKDFFRRLTSFIHKIEVIINTPPPARARNAAVNRPLPAPAPAEGAKT